MRPPRVYFSFQSPFSWMAIERLLRSVPDAFEQLEFVPYWNPDEATAAALSERGATLHYSAMNKAKHLYILQDTKRLSLAMGLPMKWPVDRAPWWEPSHLGYLAAARLGRGSAQAFYAAVVAARWHRGEDISDPEVVRGAIAAAGFAGSDAERMAIAPDDPELRAAGVGSLVRAWEDDVFGPPYFRIGHGRYWGFDRVSAVVEALTGESEDPRRAWGAALAQPSDALLATVPEPVLERVGAYDRDAPGGCG